MTSVDKTLALRFIGMQQVAPTKRLSIFTHHLHLATIAFLQRCMPFISKAACCAYMFARPPPPPTPLLCNPYLDDGRDGILREGNVGAANGEVVEQQPHNLVDAPFLEHLGPEHRLRYLCWICTLSFMGH